MKRRQFNQHLALSLSALLSGMLLPVGQLQAKNYLTIAQAKKVLWPEEKFTPVAINLTAAQMKSIRNRTRTRVLNPTPQIWRTSQGGWFIVDQVIGKHENIDIAYALHTNGEVKGLEILTYRESYGYEVANPKWRAQFHGKSVDQLLKLDQQIKNISGATLSCRHITDGINRLTQIWSEVLRHL
ncbi:MAG: FMN-binding protein [Pseudomonadales bacterium]|nr:FMN-binding protein [Pseudomonadales bacterium]